MDWKVILQREVDHKGAVKVGQEIGYSRTTVDLVLKGTYAGTTDKVKKTVMNIYGNNGQIVCAVLGDVTPAKCAETWRKAKMIGTKAGSPATLQLYKTCLNCHIREA